MMKQLLLIVLLFSVFPASAQDAESTPNAPINTPVRAEFNVDNTTPLLGEPFIITLDVIANAEITVTEWVEFDDPLDVLEESDVIRERLATGELQYRRVYSVVLWDVGEYLSGEMVVSYQQGAGVNTIPIDSFFVQVPSQIENPEEATLRPFAPTIDLPYVSPLVFIAIGAGVVLILMLLARLIQLSRRRVDTIINTSPAERAIAEIEDLKGQNLPSVMVYELVAMSLRQYLDVQYDLNASEMTTAELSEQLRTQEIFPKAHRRQLKQVLEQADLVKFAKFRPDDTGRVRLANFAIKWIKATERMRQDG